jgi:hypothetical protein
MIVLILKEIFMSVTQIERLRKDISEAVYYQRRLEKKGKSNLAYKMGKKIEYMKNCLDDTKETILWEVH